MSGAAEFQEGHRRIRLPLGQSFLVVLARFARRGFGQLRLGQPDRLFILSAQARENRGKLKRLRAGQQVE